MSLRNSSVAAKLELRRPESSRQSAPLVMNSAAGFKIRLFDDQLTLARAAARHAAELIREAIATRGKARILAATGYSQRGFLEALTQQPGIVWGEVELFHLDEFIGIGVDHPASFRRFLHERLISKTRTGRYHLLDGQHDPERVCRAEGEQLAAAPVDVAFAGIGENGHLAFNGPPADFQTEKPYLIVRLDEACRAEQVSEGGFKTLAEVPERAISISIRQLLKAKSLISVVTDARNADVIRRCMEGAISPLAPASILRTHPAATVYLDQVSASRLAKKPIPER
jgi:glucosamine-6-phosphate deaminase